MKVGRKVSRCMCEGGQENREYAKQVGEGGGERRIGG